LAGILTNLKRCCLKTENLEKMIFVKRKTSLMTFTTRSISPSNLVEFLERNIDLKEELENFESDFKRDEIVEI